MYFVDSKLYRIERQLMKRPFYSSYKLFIDFYNTRYHLINSKLCQQLFIVSFKSLRNTGTNLFNIKLLFRALAYMYLQIFFILQKVLRKR